MAYSFVWQSFIFFVIDYNNIANNELSRKSYLSAIEFSPEQTRQAHNCCNSQKGHARVLGFIIFLHFDFEMYKNPKLCFFFPFLYFKQVFCSRSRYQYKCHIFIYLGPQVTN